MDRAEAIKREARIQRLHAKGMRGSEIAEVMGVSRQRIHQLLNKLRLKPHPRSDYAKRRVKIPKLIRRGLTGAQVARECQVAPGQIYQDLRVIADSALNEKMRQNRAKWVAAEYTGRTPPALLAGILKRRHRVKSLVAKGRGAQDIAQHLKVSKPTILADFRALGLAGQRRQQIEKSAAKRRGQVRKFTRQGLSGSQIANRLGVEAQMIYNDRMWWRNQGVDL